MLYTVKHFFLQFYCGNAGGLVQNGQMYWAVGQSCILKSGTMNLNFADVRWNSHRLGTESWVQSQNYLTTITLILTISNPVIYNITSVPTLSTQMGYTKT